MDAGGVLLVGGQFDPPHLAHTALAASAREHLGTPNTWLVFVPAARSPLKPGASAPDADRLAMVRLAIAGLDRALVWTDELDRAAPGESSYWIDTLRRARNALPSQAALHFLIGADQAAQFHRWRFPHDVLALAAPVVLLRSPWRTREKLLADLRATNAWSDTELDRWSRSIIDGPLLPANSTDIRAAVRGPDSGSLPLDPRVAEYIRHHHLYGC
jgi:nicotinate-nucleotide adenylyltransferase